MKRDYFRNLNTESESLNPESLELVIPEGFHKKLNSIEKDKLLDDQLLDFNLQLGDYIMGSRKIVQANKGARHIEEEPQLSKRLQEYLEKFNNMEYCPG